MQHHEQSLVKVSLKDIAHLDSPAEPSGLLSEGCHEQGKATSACEKPVRSDTQIALTGILQYRV